MSVVYAANAVMSRTADFAETYESAVLVTMGNTELDNDEVSNGETQMRMKTDAKSSYTTLMNTTVAGGNELALVKGGIFNIGGDSGGCFCSCSSKGCFDPVLPLPLFFATVLIIRHARKNSGESAGSDLR